MEFTHISVLLEECIEGLSIVQGGVYVDGTLGGAGHSTEICKRLAGTGLLVGIDQDANAIAAAKEKLASYENVRYVHDNFSHIKNFIHDFDTTGADVPFVNGVLLDLGVSSHQFDEGGRGFSYNHDARLDMRMDNRMGLSAFDVVNTYTEDKLTTIIKDYGEERWAKRIAQFIVTERKVKPIETTFELVTVIKKAVPKGARTDGPHPAKRTFQAIRIEVNDELGILEKSILDIVDCMKAGGRLCVITFHSLEDRIVKNVFRDLENPCKCPRDFPMCMCGKKRVASVVTRKPIIPSDEELAVNHRSRSAKLRIIEKV